MSSGGPKELHSAYAKLAWARSRFVKMEHTFERFVRESDDQTPYGVRFSPGPGVPTIVRARFIHERGCRTR